MFSYKIETKKNTKKIIFITVGVIAAAAIIFILYKYVFNTSDCDGEVDVCGVCNGMGLSCCYNEKCPTNEECNPSTGSCECKSGHFDCSGVCDGTNIDCCLEDCSGNAPDCDIKTRKCFCKAGLDCDENCNGDGPPCGICKDSEGRDVHCGCIPSQDPSKCLINTEMYEFYNSNSCDINTGAYCDCKGSVYDCQGDCGGDKKLDCDNVCGGDKKLDNGGHCCKTFNASDCCTGIEKDCSGICGGTAQSDNGGHCCESLDSSGCCPGNVKDCSGICGGTAQSDNGGHCCESLDSSGCCPGFSQDCSGVCGGDKKLDCNNVCGGNAKLDECGICNGKGVNPETFCCDNGKSPQGNPAKDGCCGTSCPGVGGLDLCCKNRCIFSHGEYTCA